ncbi:hypothetical protein COU57_05190 [Candidatus Pacearchaeota archaeon CG10_big_fil_rev_8_21_14_0_10_32_14]|nr:MAG: hypothetical protein COU57_05190 [Candidatus Pacearchaeota archaeon CG10_big_fil_rev_8_21_14_0_10_32_14]
MSEIQEDQSNIINLLEESGLFHHPLDVVTSFEPKVTKNWFGRNRGYTIIAPNERKVLLRENSADLCCVNTNSDFASQNFERGDFDTLVQVSHGGYCRGSLLFREGEIEECHVHDHMSENYPSETDVGTWITYMLIDMQITFPVFRSILDSIPRNFKKRTEWLSHYGTEQTKEIDYVLYKAQSLSGISDLEKASARFGITPSSLYNEISEEWDAVGKIMVHNK